MIISFSAIQYYEILIPYIKEFICLDMGFPRYSHSKEPTSNVGDPGSIPGLGRSPGVGNGNPFQYSCLGNPMATVHGVAKTQTQLSD